MDLNTCKLYAREEGDKSLLVRVDSMSKPPCFIVTWQYAPLTVREDGELVVDYSGAFWDYWDEVIPSTHNR